MRKKALLILTVFLLIIGLTCFFWGNSIITWAIENTIQTITGAKAEIEGFRLNLFDLSVRIKSVQIANPADTWKNIIDTKKISFKLAPGPLFEGKTVIDEIILEELTFNTKRRTDGKLKKKASPKKAAKEPSKLQKTIATMPILKPETIVDNLNLEKITASYEFQTDLSTDRIKSELITYQKKWEANLSDLNLAKAELKNLDDKLTQLKKTNPKNLKELNSQLDTLNQIRDMARQIRTTVKTADEQFNQDNQELKTAVKSLKKEAETDYQTLLALAKLPDFGSINYAEALLGKTILNYSTAIINTIEQLQKSLPAKVENPPKAKPTRDGQNIVFPGRKTYPRFLIKKLTVSGKGAPDSSLDGFYAGGTLTGINSEPPIYGLPITAEIFAKASNQASLRLDGQLNHTTLAYDDRINLKLSDLSLPQIDLGDNDHLPSKLLDGKAQINAVAQMAPDLIRLQVSISADQIKMDFSGQKEPDDLIAEIVRYSLANLNQVTVNFQLEQSKDRLEIKISSNLNQLISSRVKAAVGEEVTGFTNELRAKVDAKLREGEKTLAETKEHYQQKLLSQLNDLQSQLSQEEQEIETKKAELEKKKKELEVKQQMEIDQKEQELKEKVQKELNRLIDKIEN
jgi:uncharacterized protein (TIGR03545 family)